MVDRISTEAPLIELHPSRTLPRHRLQNGRQSQDRLNVLTARFRNALKKSVEGIIEAGRVLIDAKNELDHGQFTEWVVGELRFGTSRSGLYIAAGRIACHGE